MNELGRNHAVITREMKNECNKDWQGRIIKEGRMKEGMNEKTDYLPYPLKLD